MFGALGPCWPRRKQQILSNQHNKVSSTQRQRVSHTAKWKSFMDCFPGSGTRIFYQEIKVGVVLFCFNFLSYVSFPPTCYCCIFSALTSLSLLIILHRVPNSLYTYILYLETFPAPSCSPTSTLLLICSVSPT